MLGNVSHDESRMDCKDVDTGCTVLLMQGARKELEVNKARTWMELTTLANLL